MLGPTYLEKNAKNKKYFYKEGGCTTHPHNFYIQVLAEQGIVGILFILSLNFFLLYLLIRQLLSKIFPKKFKLTLPYNEFVIVLLLFVYFWPLIPHMSFYNNWNNIFLFIPMGYFLRNLYNKD